MASKKNNEGKLRQRIITAIFIISVIYGSTILLKSKKKTSNDTFVPPELEPELSIAEKVISSPQTAEDTTNLQIYKLKSKYLLKKDIFLPVTIAKKIIANVNARETGPQAVGVPIGQNKEQQLKGISKTDSVYYALIDNDIVRVGDKIDIGKIIKITDNTVEIQTTVGKTILTLEEK